jgi:hypothetical protein
MIDKNKDVRDSSLDLVIEEKLLENLKWCMLFFVFNHLCSLLSQDEEGDIVESPGAIQKEFFKSWKGFANKHLIAEDIEFINQKLNSDTNLFSSVLKSDNEISESTEIYQEKYYELLQKVENFFFKSVNDFIRNTGEEEL